MRVCLVTGSFPNMDCGVGDYSWQLARHLAPSACVTVITSDRPAVRGFLGASREENGASMGRVDGPERSDGSVSRYEVRPVIRRWDLRSLPALRHAVLACRPDVIHIQYATSAFDTGAAINWLAPLLKVGRSRIPLLTTVHDPSGPRLFPKAGLLRPAHVRLLCRSSDLVCCPDLLVRDWLAANNIRDRVRQIPVGVNVPPTPGYDAPASAGVAGPDRAGIARAELAREHAAVFGGGPVLVTFGSVHPDRDYGSVIAALASLAAGHAPDEAGVDWRRAHWVLVGGTGRGADTGRTREVRELAARAGLADRVRLVGYAPPERVTAWMAVADLCVLLLPQGATDARGSLLAALAHGKGTITVGPGVYSSAMRDGEHLCWAPPGDPQQLAGVLDRLMQSPGERTRLGRAAADLVRRHYQWSHIAAATLEIYRELVTKETGVQAFRRSGVRVGNGESSPTERPNARTPERLVTEKGGAP